MAGSGEMATLGSVAGGQEGGVTARRVLVVDREALFRAAIARLLHGDLRVEIVGEAADGLEAIEKIPRLQPDVVVMDLRMSPVDGTDAIARMTADHPQLKVLILSDFAADSFIIKALKRGASGYMLKSTHPDALVSGILAVAAGKRVMSAPIVARMLAMTNSGDELHDGLTRREIEILKMLASGMGNKQIAYKLKSSQKTISNHLCSIYRRLGINDRSQAVLYAVRRGLVDA